MSEGAIVVAWQLGNLYLLMAFIGLGILNTTSEVRVVKAYLFALWLGDIGHIGFSAYGLGLERMSDVGQWNAVTSGNVTFTVRHPLFLSACSPLIRATNPRYIWLRRET